MELDKLLFWRCFFMNSNFSSINPNKYFLYQNITKKYDELEKEKNEAGEAFSLTSTQSTNDHNLLNHRREDTYLGRIVSILHYNTGISKFIDKIFMKYKAYAVEVDEQDRLILLLAKDSSNYYEKATIHNEKLAKIDSFIKENLSALKGYQQFKTKPETNFALMKAACGGEEAFNAIPVLELKGDAMKSHFRLKKEDMTVPIMRFNAGNQPGIAIRSNEGVQVFFQATKNGLWQTTGANILHIGDFATPDGGFNKKAYDALHTLLATREIKLEKNDLWEGSQAKHIYLE